MLQTLPWVDCLVKPCDVNDCRQWQFLTAALWGNVADEMSDEVKHNIAVQREALDLPSVDYEATLAAKYSIAREVFDACDHKLLQVLPPPTQITSP